MTDRAQPKPNAIKHVVVKIGSALLAPNGEPDDAAFSRYADRLASWHAQGLRVTLVSSGAVACGLPVMGFDAMPERIVDKQACAAAGQARLVARWSVAFEARGLGVAQVLLTRDDVSDRSRFLNARHTLGALADRGLVAIVNENDSVAFDEIRLGDNDTLSAHVAGLVSADRLVVLTGVPGLLDAEGRLVPRVDDPASARPLVRTERSATGVGGFATKLEAARAAASHGVPTLVADGRDDSALKRALNDDPLGTLFASAASPVGTSRKRWIATATSVRGAIVTDDGARRAVVERGASLLASGVVGVEGRFAMGDAVELRDSAGRAYARGLASYPSEDVARVAGQASDRLRDVLGYAYSDALVHRNDLVVLS